MKERDKEAQEKTLQSYMRRLCETIPVEAVVLFGSRARNEAFPRSDFDLAVVSDFFDSKSRIQRMEILLQLWTDPAPAEILGFTSWELLRLDRPIIWEIVEYGEPLLDAGIFRRARHELQEKKDKGELVPIPGGWRFRQPKT